MALRNYQWKSTQSQISLFCITKQAIANEDKMRHNMFKVKWNNTVLKNLTLDWARAFFSGRQSRHGDSGWSVPIVLSFKVQEFKLKFSTQLWFKGNAINFSRENTVNSFKIQTELASFVNFKQFWHWIQTWNKSGSDLSGSHPTLPVPVLATGSLGPAFLCLRTCLERIRDTSTIDTPHGTPLRAEVGAPGRCKT